MADNSIIHPGLDQTVAAGRSLILVQTFEEDRLERLLSDLAQHYDKEFFQWQVNTGLVTPEGPVTNTKDPVAALHYFLDRDEAPFVWFKGLHHHYDPEVTRCMRDLYYAWRDHGGVLFISAHQRAIPPELEREMIAIRLDMPSRLELTEVLEEWLQDEGADYQGKLDPKVLSGTLKGLTLSEAKHALKRVASGKPPVEQALAVLQEEKRLLIQKSGTLEFIPRVPPLKDVGGLDNLKDWLVKRRELMFLEGKDAQELTPKGMLLMGVSGCGKSLCIKAVSSAWQLPLYRIDMSRIFSGTFGSPEQAFSDACRLMEEMAPAILWIDEIEMGLCADGSTAADATLSRIFAFFLTWMQEKPPGLFVAATANRIDLLPAEMIRKGRFDQVFFVDLPTYKEREHIFRIHLERRGYDPEEFNLEVFVDASEGWNGAEIEQCVIAAVTSAKMEGRELTLKDMYQARKQIVPISTTMEEQVRHIRNWAYERALRASPED